MGMKKAINLQAQLQCDTSQDPQQLSADLESAFAEANPGMRLTVKSLKLPDSAGHAAVRVYIEGEQEPAAPFEPVAKAALHKAIAALASTRGRTATPLAAHNVQEVEDDDEEGGDLV